MHHRAHDAAGRSRWTGMLQWGAASILMSVGVVAMQHARHMGSAGAVAEDWRHVARDVLLALPLAFVALRGAGLCLRRLGARRRGTQVLLQAVAASCLFGSLLVPGVLVHERLDDALGHEHTEVAGHGTGHGEETGGAGHRHAVPAGGDSHIAHAAGGESQIAHAAGDAVRSAWTAFPLALLAFLLLNLRRSPVEEPREVLAHRRRLPALARLGAVVAFCAGLLAPTDDSPAAAETTSSGASVVSTGCAEVAAVVPLPAERVRPYVPPEFVLSGALVRETAGQVDAFVRAYDCETQTVGDDDGNGTKATVRDATTVSIGVFIDDGERGPGLYTFLYLTNNPYVAPWLKAGTGVQWVHYVRDLEMTHEAMGAAAYRYTVSAPAPSPSPFRMTATAPIGAPPGIRIIGHWWSELPGARSSEASYVRLTNTVPAFRAAAGVVQLDLAPGTFMARLFATGHVTTYSLGGEFDLQTTSWTVEASPPAPSG